VTKIDIAMTTRDFRVTEKLAVIMNQYESVFANISTGGTKFFDEIMLGDMFMDARNAMDEIYTGSETMFKDGQNTDALMALYQSVRFVTSQFDDPLQAGLLMKMDVFASILAMHDVYRPLLQSSAYVIDCTSVDFSGLFFEEALPDGPWKPSAEDYPIDGDWIGWCRADMLLGKKRKRLSV
jgi:hypothetical protein